jgi:hypothetical protein
MKHHLPFSDLQETDFSAESIGLIKQLIKTNEWTEEESQDFKTMLIANKLIGS